jgi:hypothetical protein
VGEADEPVTDRGQRLLSHIQQITATHGPYSFDLLEPLQALVLLHQENGEHEFAVVAIERAQQVIRVNHGLHTLDQVPLLLQRRRSEQARGNDLGVWELERDLMALIRRHPDDLDTVAVLREIADRQMDRLRQYLEGDATPEVVYGCFYKPWPNADGGSCTAGSRRIAVQGMLAEAQRNYADAIAILLRHGLYDSDELRDLETDLLLGVDLIRTVYERPGQSSLALVPGTLGAEHREPWRGRMAPLIELAGWELPGSGDDVLDENAASGARAFMSTYDRGRQSLSRLYAYEVASSRPLLVQAEALARVADWDLLYSYNGKAVGHYENILTMLRKTALPTESIEQVFAPPVPVVLPAFDPNPLAYDDASSPSGYIEVAFSITKYGRARDIEVRSMANATEEVRKTLFSLIRSSRFRPRVIDGQFGDSTPVAFRYYVHDAPLHAMAD